MEYQFKVLNVDLTKKIFSTELIPGSIVKKFLGGKGIGAFILYNELGRYRNRTDPFDERNPVIFATGPITGTMVPGSAKYAVVTKSPLTGTFLDTLSGGFWGAELKLAGYDVLVIRGKAEKLTYLFIDNEKVQFKDASRLHLLSCSETEDAIRDELADSEIRILSIGPAGENLVRFACVANDYHRYAGRGGAGAVLGSKKLKAIALRGSLGIRIADPEGFVAIADKCYETVKNSSGYIYMCTTGTMTGMEVYSFQGVFPTRNHFSGVFEGTANISDSVLRERYVQANKACYACNERCGQYSVVAAGKYRTQGVGPEYESLAMLGPNCGIDNIEAIIKANVLAGELGLDTISAGSAVAFAMECYERGILNLKDTNKLQLEFGNADALLELMKAIGYREGIGDLLAEGTKIASERIGHDSDRFAIHVKGLDLPGYEARSLWALALGYATSDRGGCHMRASTADDEIAGVWGDRLSASTYASGKGQVVKHRQDEMAWKNSICICKFPGQKRNNLEEVLSAITGWKIADIDLNTIGERVYNLTRCFNVREGFQRKDDTLPARYFEEPLADGPPKGMRVLRSEFEKMLDDYYAARGWDANGVPTEETIERLGLADLLKQSERPLL